MSDKLVFMDTGGRLYAATSAKTPEDVHYPRIDASLIDTVITDKPKTLDEIEREMNIPRDQKR